MKNFLIFIAFCCLSTWIHAQDTATEKHFIALYTVGEGWDMEKQPAEQPYFKEHSAFLSQLRKEKNIVIGARYSDTGMLVLKAKDLETVKKLLNQDIAIQNKLFNLIIHPFTPFYKGCVE
ncbi:hypothetical protein LV716_08990 [Flagellimonas sp. HMM57]|uniref:YciI family protein n=1 Tax=unclassified Flagellimonas TaxID=2644544 RepID=UPI0013D03F66|nr:MULTISPECIES: hypothetical protein [unclassified Flagellimonas]UII77889.1 hypothetical protein LV716_08990 [Flagellimonas sp. HMM57]